LIASAGTSGASPSAIRRAFSSEGTDLAWLIAMVLLAALPVAGAGLARRFVRASLWFSAGYLALLGAFVWFVAVCSTVPELRYNEGLLVLLPTDLLLAGLRGTWRVRYARARVAVLAALSLAVAVGLLRQPLFLLILMPALPCLAIAVWPARYVQTP
jgi:hypothetical protein